MPRLEQDEIEDLIHKICSNYIEQIRQELQQEIDHRADELERRINDLERGE